MTLKVYKNVVQLWVLCSCKYRRSRLAVRYGAWIRYVGTSQFLLRSTVRWYAFFVMVLYVDTLLEFAY